MPRSCLIANRIAPIATPIVIALFPAVFGTLSSQVAISGKPSQITPPIGALPRSISDPTINSTEASMLLNLNARYAAEAMKNASKENIVMSMLTYMLL